MDLTIQGGKENSHAKNRKEKTGEGVVRKGKETNDLAGNKNPRETNKGFKDQDNCTLFIEVKKNCQGVQGNWGKAEKVTTKGHNTRGGTFRKGKNLGLRETGSGKSRKGSEKMGEKNSHRDHLERNPLERKKGKTGEGGRKREKRGVPGIEGRGGEVRGGRLNGKKA